MSYFEIPAISNSSLSYIDPQSGGNPMLMKAYLEGSYKTKESDAMALGTLIHTYLLEPELIVTVDIEEPAPKVKQTIDAIYAYQKEQPLATYKPLSKIEDVVTALLPEDFYPKYKTPTRLAKVMEGEAYYKTLFENEGKVIITQSDYEQVIGCVENINLHPTAKLLISGVLEGYEEAHNEMELLYNQVVIGGEDEASMQPIKLDFKSKLDRVHINHTTKRIVLVDLKTTRSPLGRFGDVVENSNYHRQMAFYKRGLEIAYPGYEIEAIYIVAVQTNKMYPVEVFEVHESLIEIGNELIKECLDRIVYHTVSGNWLFSMEAQLGMTTVLRTAEN